MDTLSVLCLAQFWVLCIQSSISSIHQFNKHLNTKKCFQSDDWFIHWLRLWVTCLFTTWRLMILCIPHLPTDPTLTAVQSPQSLLTDANAGQSSHSSFLYPGLDWLLEWIHLWISQSVLSFSDWKKEKIIIKFIRIRTNWMQKRENMICLRARVSVATREVWALSVRNCEQHSFARQLWRAEVGLYSALSNNVRNICFVPIEHIKWDIEWRFAAKRTPCKSMESFPLSVDHRNHCDTSSLLALFLHSMHPLSHLWYRKSERNCTDLWALERGIWCFAQLSDAAPYVPHWNGGRKIEKLNETRIKILIWRNLYNI